MSTKKDNKLYTKASRSSNLLYAAHILSQIGRYSSAKTLVSKFLEDNYETSALESLAPKFDRSLARLVAPLLLARHDGMKVKEWLGELSAADAVQARNFGEARFLVWADINLNVVDGSSAWLVSMARVLGRIGKTILLSKADLARRQVVSPLLNDPSILIIQPSDYGEPGAMISTSQAADLIAEIDDVCPILEGVVVRGVAAVEALTTDRRFQHRLIPYLTDIYKHSDSGIRPNDGVNKRIDAALRQCRFALFQTKELEDFTSRLTGISVRSMIFPPPVGEELLTSRCASRDDDASVIRIGYAGKIAPNWGVEELIEWTNRLICAGYRIEVHIFGDKIFAPGGADVANRYRQYMARHLDADHVHRHGALAREEVVSRMCEMDFAWCWRPRIFEMSTLELSSKLVEGVASGQRCIALPSPINRDFLGDDYPFFLCDEKSFAAVLEKRGEPIPSSTRARVIDDCAIKHQAIRLDRTLTVYRATTENVRYDSSRSIAILGHDLKFVYPWYSWMKSIGIPVRLDRGWEWERPKDPAHTQQVIAESDVVFCEWGLGNAVWTSKNLPFGKRMVIRLHAQEVRDRAQKMVRSILPDPVHKFLFVSDWVREAAIGQYEWPADRCVTVPNYLQDEEFRYHPPIARTPLVLAMVGILPRTKRFDRALDLLAALRGAGLDVELRIKGHRPFDQPMMHAPHRRSELEEYERQFSRIKQDGLIKGRVHFDPWGNDVALFYSGADVILSPSESESFHYALADGVLSGCFPIVWNWQHADQVYDASWVVRSTEEAVMRITQFLHLPLEIRTQITHANRDRLIEKYGKEMIYRRLLKEAGIAESDA